MKQTFKTKETVKTLFLIILFSFITISCNSEDDSLPETPIPDTSFKFEAGDYNISWEGYPFKTNLTKTDENTLIGRFCVNDDINNCEDIGPITITRDENNVTFKFSDIVCTIVETNLPGEFFGEGTITADNVYRFIVNGEDCVQQYTNNVVVLTKI